MGYTSILHEYFAILRDQADLRYDGAPYAVGCETEAKWYDPRTWLSGVSEGDGSLCPLRVAAEAGHADVVAFLAELLPDVDPATGKRRTKEL